ncbi:hypothetical protein [Pseudovibrio sp. POLY-S9]|uniref:hypothetical protein n=1 Tax=Pseudovibrio sp. POLY-S9 TaxID=1576596 RepID=UPI000710DA04|nr:hypothetical protein [Pseudovibrio sp. POLY-S9]
MNKIKHIVGPTIALRSGQYFDLKQPWACEFSIEDIAHALANLCRFTGHCKQFYSVAEHSVFTSQIVPPEFALEGLLHDAAEAFIGDIAKPLKSILPDYAVIEERVENAVLTRLGVPVKMSPEIKHADLRMLKAEQFQAMEDTNVWPLVDELDAADIKLEFWPPERAKQEFLQRFEELAA